MDALPLNVWRFWTGSPEPEWMRQCGETWDQPGWQCVTLYEPPFTLRNQDVYDAADELAPNHAGQLRADVLRLELLHRYGGVWADTDFQLIRPIDDLMHSPWLAWEIQDIWLNHAVIAAPPGDPWLDRLIRQLPHSVKVKAGKKPSVMTGPQFITPQWSHASGWAAYPQAWFYPLTWKQGAQGAVKYRFGKDVRAVHWWANKRQERGVRLPDPGKVKT